MANRSTFSGATLERIGCVLGCPDHRAPPTLSRLGSRDAHKRRCVELDGFPTVISVQAPASLGNDEVALLERDVGVLLPDRDAGTLLRADRPDDDVPDALAVCLAPIDVELDETSSDGELSIHGVFDHLLDRFAPSPLIRTVRQLP